MKTPKTKRIRLRVTREMIKRAKRSEPGSCVGALALAARFPGKHVLCLLNTFRVDGHRYQLSKALIDYTAMFDAGKPVKPRTFYVRVPV